jgi:hypothetical protein
VKRATPWSVSPGLELTTCSAEDLVVHKAFAARVQDWADIINILMRQGPKLNLDQIWTELRPLIALKEEPEIEGELQKLINLHMR